METARYTQATQCVLIVILGQILQVNDDVVQIALRYKQVIEEGKYCKYPCNEY